MSLALRVFGIECFVLVLCLLSWFLTGFRLDMLVWLFLVCGLIDFRTLACLKQVQAICLMQVF